MTFFAQDQTVDRNVGRDEARLLQFLEDAEATLAGDDAIGAVRAFADHDDTMPAFGRCRWLQLVQRDLSHVLHPASVAHATEDAPSARRGG